MDYEALKQRINHSLGIASDGVTFDGVTYCRPRVARQAAARKKGTHTKAEWFLLCSVFGECVSCGIPFEQLHGGEPTKDHIVPIIAGGCDCIANVQPLCRNCNSSHVGMDCRAAARPDWLQAYLGLLANG